MFSRIRSGLFLVVFASGSIHAEMTYLDDPIKNSDWVTWATNMPQSKSRSPASTTVYSAADIQRYNIRSLFELFERAPGMTVADRGGFYSTIGINSDGLLVERRIMVSINGVSVVQPGYPYTDWGSFFIPVELIDRVEITRSSSSPSHGSEALLGAINFITKAPKQLNKKLESYISERQSSVYLETKIGSKNSFIGISLAQQKRSPFDSIEYQDGLNENARDDGKSTSLNVSIEKNFVDLRIKSDIRYVESEQNKTRLSFLDNAPPDISTNYFMANTAANWLTSQGNEWELSLDHSRYHLDQTWSLCLDEVALESIFNITEELLDFLGAPPFCGYVDNSYNFYRTSISAKTIRKINESRLVAGWNLTKMQFNSEKYNSPGKTEQQAYFNLETQWSDYFSTNAGFLSEYSDDIGEFITSYRVSTNFRILPHHTLRYAFSLSKRAPDSFETNRDKLEVVFNLDQPVLLTDNITLSAEDYNVESSDSPEKLYLHEVGVLGDIAAFEYDLRLYQQKLHDLYQYNPDFVRVITNQPPEVSSTRRGIELEAVFRHQRGELGGSISYTDSESDQSIGNYISKKLVAYSSYQFSSVRVYGTFVHSLNKRENENSSVIFKTGLSKSFNATTVDFGIEHRNQEIASSIITDSELISKVTTGYFSIAVNLD